MKARSILIAAVVGAGVVWRLYGAATTSFNPDEVIMVLSSDRSDAEMQRAAAGHPPLLGTLLGLVGRLSTSELALRMPSVLAGSLLPLIVYAWLRTSWSQATAFFALVVLTLSPNLVALSTQARGYTLVMSFSALALWCLDRAIADRSVPKLLAFTAALYFAMLTAYSAAWIAGGAGVYVLLQLRGMPSRWTTTWAVGQLGGLGLCAVLVAVAPVTSDATRQEWIGGFLRGAFPQPGDDWLTFAAVGTLKQFSYVFSSVPAGVVALGLFVFGLTVMWRTDATAGSGGARTMLLLVPFLLACVGAILQVHPYGRSRHTVVLGILMSLPVAVAIERGWRLSPRMGGTLLLLALPIWLATSEPDQHNISADRARRSSMISAVEELRRRASGQSVVFTDQETMLLLRYYTVGLQPTNTTEFAPGVRQVRLGPLNVAWSSWDLGGAANFEATADRLGAATNPQAPRLLVVDGGFDVKILSSLEERGSAGRVANVQNFDGALLAFDWNAR